MKSAYLMTITMVAAVVISQAPAGHAADVDGMLSACRTRAAKVLGVSADTVAVTYEGQRVDKTHAVNGSAHVRGQEETFQCSFARDGRKIERFVVNEPQASEGGGDRANDAMRRASEGNFDAEGKIPCARYKGQPMNQCDFGVARANGGTATVMIHHPGGGSRMIYFTKGQATGADTSQADGNAAIRVTKESDLYMIRIGDERYEIPEAVIFGG